MRISSVSKFGSIAVVAAALALGGCATPVPGGYYYRGEALRAQSVELGVVESARPIVLQGPDTGLGAVSGATLGGIAGSAVGGGAGQAAAIVGGALLGGIIGNAVEVDANRRPGVEVTVRLDNGRMIAVVQEDAGDAFRPGDRVRVLSDGYRTRVVH